MTDNVVNDLFSYFHRVIAINIFLPQCSGCFLRLPSGVVAEASSPNFHLAGCIQTEVSFDADNQRSNDYK
jgi:hypothetical protein